MKDQSILELLILLLITATLYLVAWPLLGIWALNTLFPQLAIEWSWSSWLAALILIQIFTANTWRKMVRSEK